MPNVSEPMKGAPENRIGSQNSINKSGPPSTIQGPHGSSHDNTSNNIPVGSQSRIKVNLSQNEDDTMQMDEDHHLIQPKPMLGNASEALNQQALHQ